MRNKGMKRTGIAFQGLLALREWASGSNFLHKIEWGHAEENRYEEDSSN
jgi:hypothetical protein